MQSPWFSVTLGHINSKILLTFTNILAWNMTWGCAKLGNCHCLLVIKAAWKVSFMLKAKTVWNKWLPQDLKSLFIRNYPYIRFISWHSSIFVVLSALNNLHFQSTIKHQFVSIFWQIIGYFGLQREHVKRRLMGTICSDSCLIASQGYS